MPDRSRPRQREPGWVMVFLLGTNGRMGIFAWRNLLTRPLRTTLALIGLSIPILGVMGLFSVSRGLRNMVGDTLSRVEGLMVLSENTPSPVFSHLKSSMADTIRRLPGIRHVATEVWAIAPNIEGRGMISGLMSGRGAQSILDQPVIQGQDIAAHRHLKSAVYPRALREHGEGRFLGPEDRHSANVVISRKIARDHPRPDGKPRKLGDTIHIGGKPFKIIGLYETGSMILDVVILMDIDTARKLLGWSDEQASSFYVEADNPARNREMAKEITDAIPRIEARSMNEFLADFGALMGNIDTFLFLTISLALLVGIVGIVNTMLMSTTERFVEFGVLRTNGWSQGNILTLVTLESAYLGLLAGMVGGALAILGALVANQFLGGGLHLSVPPWLLGFGVGLSVVTGTIGGLYPAWRAARLVPMDAIRVGSH